MKLLIRYFSLGLFTAGILMLGILLFSANNSAKELSTEELIPLLKNEGYHVLTNDEYISLSLSSDDEDTNKSDSKESEKQSKKEVNQKKDSKKKNSKKEDKEEDADEEESKKSYTINIKSGMPTSTISSELEENGIINNASKFTKYLEEHDYALKVKAKKAEVHSDMSFYELAQALINY